MMGRKVRVYYRGITKLCNKKNCQNKKVGLIDYIKKFNEKHKFLEELYGNWITILKLNKSRKQKQKQKEEHLKTMRLQREETKKTEQNQRENTIEKLQEDQALKTKENYKKHRKNQQTSKKRKEMKQLRIRKQ